MYDSLVAALTALQDIDFTQYEWATRPSGDFGTVQLDFEAPADVGDNGKRDRAMAGSVDLFLHSINRTKITEVETILENILGSEWSLNSIQYETETGLLHFEWAFQVVI